MYVSVWVFWYVCYCELIVCLSILRCAVVVCGFLGAWCVGFGVFVFCVLCFVCLLSGCGSCICISGCVYLNL